MSTWSRRAARQWRDCTARVSHLAWHDPIPGDLGLPFIGHMRQFNDDLLGWLERYRRRHGLIFKARVFGEVTVALLGAQANRFVLSEQATSFSNHGGWGSTLGTLFRGGLMLKDGEDHKRHRRILQVAFRPQVMAGYLDQMRPIIEKHVADWTRRSWLRAYPAAKELTLQIAAKVFIGVDLEQDVKRINRAFLDLVKGSISLVRLAIPGLPYQRALLARRKLSDFFAKVIGEQRDAPNAAMLGQLMSAESEEGEKLNQLEIIDHLVFLMMAAHDTTTSTLASLLYRLGSNPEWQERARAESQAIDGPLTYHRMEELRTLDLALKETLRLHPPVTILPRRCVEPVQFNGFSLPAGTLTALTPVHTHRMEEYFSEPESFMPERFETKPAPYSYLPFGAGSHTCVGLTFAEMEIKLLMHTLLRSRSWETVEGYRPAYKQVPMNTPADGLPILFR